LDLVLQNNSTDWFVRETSLPAPHAGTPGRLVALDLRPCGTGLLLRGHARRAALRRDRSYMLDAENGPSIAFSPLNFGTYPW